MSSFLLVFFRGHRVAGRGGGGVRGIGWAYWGVVLVHWPGQLSAGGLGIEEEKKEKKKKKKKKGRELEGVEKRHRKRRESKREQERVRDRMRDRV